LTGRRTRRRNTPPAESEQPPIQPDDLTETDPHKFAFSLAGIVILALAVRLIHVAQTQSVPSAASLIGDAMGYFQWAARISGGNWYGDETFYQAPLYPYSLAVIMSVCGQSVTAIRVTQAILGALSVGLIGLAAKSLFDRSAGLVAALMLAVLPAAIYYDGLIQKASLASFLLCLFLSLIAPWLAATRTDQDHETSPAGPSRLPDWRSVFAVGLVLALLMLVRENTLLWIPLPLLWFWLTDRNGTDQTNSITTDRTTTKARMMASAAYLVGLGCVLFPVAARNASLGGEWSPTTFQAGPNFYIGNNINSNGIYAPLVPGHETPLHERSDAVHIAEQTTGHAMSAREVSRFWFARSWDEIASEPARWIGLMMTKSLMVFNYFEVPDVESLVVYRDHSVVLLMFDRFWHFGTIAVLATLGLVLTAGQWKRLWLWYALIAVLTIAIVAFFILGRYRFPLAVLLIPFAATGAVECIRRIRKGDFRGLLSSCLAAAVTALICHLPVHDTRTLNASSFANLGAAAAEQGQIDQAILFFRRGIDEAPEMPEARLNLGRAMMLQGRMPAAIEQFRTALRIQPDLADADFFLATALERTGQLDLARQHYRRAQRINPDDPRIAEALRRLGPRQP
jgi:hypothetical protein